ncbi:hypothetical protein QBC46DRAFT_412582 [Diplogelasinospora grovesii]|uniref:Uncharacterized protein n=1 Tax=Diplogelasinospora grovesii TaxID=303347 RepID=A0AAN6S124_9PEZI|nr:hypothetical protein QBC46DRAFT_412582 [Diplogelasinospora grovesii]
MNTLLREFGEPPMALTDTRTAKFCVHLFNLSGKLLKGEWLSDVEVNTGIKMMTCGLHVINTTRMFFLKSENWRRNDGIEWTQSIIFNRWKTLYAKDPKTAEDALVQFTDHHIAWFLHRDGQRCMAVLRVPLRPSETLRWIKDNRSLESTTPQYASNMGLHMIKKYGGQVELYDGSFTSTGSASDRYPPSKAIENWVGCQSARQKFQRHAVRTTGHNIYVV